MTVVPSDVMVIHGGAVNCSSRGYRGFGTSHSSAFGTVPISPSALAMERLKGTLEGCITGRAEQVPRRITRNLQARRAVKLAVSNERFTFASQGS